MFLDKVEDFFGGGHGENLKMGWTARVHIGKLRTKCTTT
jgi:hypothetical protein